MSSDIIASIQGESPLVSSSGHTSTTTSYLRTVDPDYWGLPSRGEEPLLYDIEQRVFVDANRNPIYPSSPLTWIRTTSRRPIQQAQANLAAYFQRNPVAEGKDIAILFTGGSQESTPIEPTTEDTFTASTSRTPTPTPSSSSSTPIISAPTPRRVTMATIGNMTQQQLEALIARLQTQQQGARALKLDIPAPDPFTGQGEDLDRFIQRVEHYFTTTNNTNLSDDAKIAFTVALMKGGQDARIWRDTFYERAAGGQAPYRTWDLFKGSLKLAFPEHEGVQRAHQVLMELPAKQLNKKTRATTKMYVERFRLLAEKAKLKDATIDANGQRTENDYPTLRAIFIKGLDRQIYATLAGRATSERPDTMDKWYRDVLSLDAIYRGIDQISNVTTSVDYGEPMDVDAAVTRPIRTSSSAPGRKQWTDGCSLNESERRYHRNNNLCFYCHNGGHSARDCRKKAAAGTKNTPRAQNSRPTDYRSYIKSLSADEKREVMEELATEDF
ncbi:hypothetical protein AcV7_002157 [Taiwanofungus camphoratus]|nr:hypothetical protein AcV7_002157 [Antrodia cinnamomea]